jgi:LCP family protein required for cell wall assembly
MAVERPAPHERLAAIEAQAWARDARAVPDLLRDLHDADRLVRRMAAMALGRIGDAQAVPGLIQALRDQDRDVRLAAAQALGWLGDRQAVYGLLSALHDQDSRVRWAAVQALGRLRDASAVPALQDALDDPDREVRRIAARALKHFEGVVGKPAPAQVTQVHRTAVKRRRSGYRGLVLGGILAILVITGLLACRAWNQPLGPQLVTVAPPTENEVPPAPTAAPALSSEPSGPPLCGGPELMYLLIVGSDTLEGDYESGHADVIRVARIDFVSPAATVLALPRDMWVRIPGLEQYGIIENRLKTAYAYGNSYEVPGGGPSLLMQTMAQNFGVRVDHYAVINFDAFVAGINAIGGIDITIPEPVDGSWQDLPYFEAGDYHMDGETALAYARIREDNTTDLYRIDHQTQVILGIRERVLNPQVLPALPRLIDTMQGSMLTDMSPAQISTLLCIGQHLGPDDIHLTKIDYSMTTREITAWDFEVLLPDYEAITQFVQEFNAGTLPLP